MNRARRKHWSVEAIVCLMLARSQERVGEVNSPVLSGHDFRTSRVLLSGVCRDVLAWRCCSS